ncbi:MAG TPA: BrnA antitoxin family protein [Lamprocystis sp. (in: g-proteobacteria)]|nr:BrnA antitoxin family protein [Lamprocystis sp. (in: g-proteobacteria)]
MNDATTGNTLAPERGTDWEALRGMSGADIRAGIKDDPDVHATDAAFWRTAKVVMPQCEQTVTMRLDADLLAWFRKENGYQTRINAILRAYMMAHQSAGTGHGNPAS